MTMHRMLAVALLCVSASSVSRRAHWFVYDHNETTLDLIKAHKNGIQSISLGCKCHASLWEEKTKADASATWCPELEECRSLVPELKKLGIDILMNVNLGANKYVGRILADAGPFSVTLKSMAAEFGTQGFSFDFESGGTAELGDEYVAFLETLSLELGSAQELMVTGGHHTAMTHDIANLTVYGDWFSMNTYSFDGQSKWQKLVASEFANATRADRYVPGVSAGAEKSTHWDAETLKWALGELDAMGISRLGVFGVAKPDLAADQMFFWDTIESWVTGSDNIALV